MYDAIKAGCIAIYLLAVAGTCGWLPSGIASAVQILAVVLLGLYVLELPIAFRFLRKHQGPLVDSIALTLLFGFLHWLPLKKRA
jgi:hypothetical protein